MTSRADPLRLHLEARLDGYTAAIRDWTAQQAPAAAGAFLAVGPHPGEGDVPPGEDPGSWLQAYHDRLHDLIPRNREDCPGLPGGRYVLFGRGAADAGLPLPLTLGAALDLVELRRLEVVEVVEAEIRAAVNLLCPEVAGEVLADPSVPWWWPWPTRGGPAVLALGCLPSHFREVTGDPARAEDPAAGDWPPELDPAEVVGWILARIPVERSAVLSRYLLPPGDPTRLPLHDFPRAGSLPLAGAPKGPATLLPPVGLALLYRAWRRTSAGGAARAWELLRDLTRDPAGALPPAVQEAAALALDVDQERGDPSPEARDALAREVLRELPALRRAVALDGCAPPADPERAELDARPLLWWDAALAAHLKALGEHGREAAGLVREGAAERWAEVAAAPDLAVPGTAPRHRADLWRLWLPERPGGAGPTVPDLPPKVLRLLALALWRERVRNRLEAHQRFAPAMTGPAQLDLLALCSPGRRLVAGEGPRVRVLDATGIREVATMTIPPDTAPGVATVNAAILAELDRRAAILGTTTFLRVFAGLLGYASTRKAEDPERTDAGILDFPGGWERLAELARSHPSKVRQAVVMGSCVHVTGPGMEMAGLWTSYLSRGNQYKGSGVLRIGLNPGLWPGRAPGYRLAPVLPPDREPALPPASDLQAPALRFTWGILRRFTERWAELLRDGGIPLARVDLEALAAEVGAPGRLPAILGPLVEGNDSRPPLLVELAPGRFDLAPDFSDVRAFLVDGAERSRSGRSRARIGAERRDTRRKAAETREAGQRREGRKPKGGSR